MRRITSSLHSINLTHLACCIGNNLATATENINQLQLASKLVEELCFQSTAEQETNKYC